MTASTVPQHLAALEYANKIRLKRAAIKRDVKRGKRSIQRVVESPPPELARMTVGELLRAQDRWGHQRTMKFCARFQISTARQLGRLSERQRMAIAAGLSRP